MSTLYIYCRDWLIICFCFLVALAGKQGCQVVNVKWLLESIQKKVPENVQEYLLKHGEGEQATVKPKIGKRGREDETEGDGVDLKRAKIEEKINFEMLADLVDEDFPSASQYLEFSCSALALVNIWPSSGERVSVWFDDSGFVWDATLVNLKSKATGSRLMHLQLLFDSESKEFVIWTSWHYPSVSGSNKLSVHLNLDSAKDSFLSEFKCRTGLHWNDRHSDPRLERWASLEISPREVPLITKDGSELPTKVKNVLETMFKGISLQNYSNMLTSHGRNVVLTDKMSQRKLQIGLAMLKKQLDIKKFGFSGKLIQNLGTMYKELVLSPHVKPLSSPYEVRKELDTLGLLLKLHIAGEVSKISGYSSLSLGQISQAIGLAKMDPGMTFCGPGHIRR